VDTPTDNVDERTVNAVMFDFGGVITTSPFDAFRSYEQRRSLPTGFIRSLNATNPDDNAWARLERNEVGTEEFCELFEAEARRAGYELSGSDVLNLLSGRLRPEMVEAVRRCRERLRTACVTNNFRSALETRTEMAEVLALFDVVVASSEVGVRKPERRFYELACNMLGVEPREVVILDDLGANLKPARAMGMRTIKVVSPSDALAELERVVGIPLVA
jgi:putative hydrolase of the HAD superfamily